ncbi:MAG: hypothetical protein P9L97_01455 [Candidatus Tenebribacter davisii]|nr:hypothetical protein [Candidatus Tenebribacter davisii]
MKKIFLLVLLFLLFSVGVTAEQIDLPGTGIRVVGRSAGSIVGPLVYLKWQIYPSVNWVSGGCNPANNPTSVTSGGLTFLVPWDNVGHCNYWVTVYNNCCDSEDEDSWPEGYEMITENRNLGNPFDESIWIKVFYDGEAIDTQQIYSGENHLFELRTFAGPDDPKNFEYKISPHGITYDPTIPVDWYNLIKILSKLFTD